MLPHVQERAGAWPAGRSPEGGEGHAPALRARGEGRAFGSRVGGRAKPHSDLDMALVGGPAILDLTLAQLEAAFPDSDLPFRVDGLDWAMSSLSFRQIIGQRYEIVPPRRATKPVP